jgi:hypothetical protein
MYFFIFLLPSLFYVVVQSLRSFWCLYKVVDIWGQSELNKIYFSKYNVEPYIKFNWNLLNSFGSETFFNECQNPVRFVEFLI